jgi:hypothetical protein
MAFIFSEGLDEVVMATHDQAFCPLVIHCQPSQDTLLQA